MVKESFNKRFFYILYNIPYVHSFLRSARLLLSYIDIKSDQPENFLADRIIRKGTLVKQAMLNICEILTESF
ncbi:hypothetical protein WQ54_15975 [Bacillus sp. SA1-12]|nr:hypothetical protein WQ54_15975 [Bacillus sp. SA1-12]